MPVTKNKSEVTATVAVTKKNQSINKRSELTYQWGLTTDRSVAIRTLSTSGGAIFSSEWLLLDSILEAIDKHPKNSPITSIIFNRQFVGKSANNPSMLLSHLVSENLLTPIENRQRQFHLAMSTQEFKEKIQALLSAADKAKTKPKTVRKKTSSKKRQLLNSTT